MSHSLRPVPIDVERPNLFEEWQAGSYVVTVLFPIFLGNDAAQARLPASIPEVEQQAAKFLAEAKRLKKGFWPRGIASYHLIPLYILPEGEFSAELHREVMHRSQYWKYAIYLDPILCELETGRVTLRYGFENKRFLLTKFFMRVLLSALQAVASVHAPESLKAFDVNNATLRLPIAK